MNTSGNTTIDAILSLPFFQAEWVIWVLLAMSVLSMGVIMERLLFFYRHRVNLDEMKRTLMTHLRAGDFESARVALEAVDSMETNTVRFGLAAHRMGPDAVEDLLVGEGQNEQSRFERHLGILGTIAATAPFLGLFGTVLGITRSFTDLALNMNDVGSSVMAGIADALNTTAVGLVVAVPTLVMFNYFKSRVKKRTDNLTLLSAILTASLKSVEHTEDAPDGKAA